LFQNLTIMLLLLFIDKKSPTSGGTITFQSTIKTRNKLPTPCEDHDSGDQ
jgi:hypothetical protein